MVDAGVRVGSRFRQAAAARRAERRAQRPGRALGRLTYGFITTSIVVMVAALLVRGTWFSPFLPVPSPGPPWDIHQHLPGVAVVGALWGAGLLAGAGIWLGLVAARRGAHVPIRALLITAALGVLALILLPPAGSTDALDYAAYGHIALAGHNPYVMTPEQFSHTHVVLPGIPAKYAGTTSVYGPLATLVQLVAAWLGNLLGPGSLAATVFYLKLANAGAFAAVAVAAHRRLRADPASQLRAHLLWTANPLLLWTVIAAGHLDVLAAAVGIFGLLICDGWAKRPTQPVRQALAVGVCIGLAIDIKASYVFFALAVAWAMRRRPLHLLAAAGAASVVVLASLAITGWVAVTSTLNAAGGQGMYTWLLSHVGALGGHVLPEAGGLAAVAIILALWRLPPGYYGGAAMRTALAISLGWLLVWPEQYAWYAIMVVCVLIFYPASRLDWLVLAWLTMTTITNMPGRGLSGKVDPMGTVLAVIHDLCFTLFQPLVVIGVLVMLIVFSITRRWNAYPPERLGGVGGVGGTGRLATVTPAG